MKVDGKSGILKGGRYGYDEQEMLIVDRVFHMADEGMSNRKIAMTLTMEGVPTRRGGSGSQATISQMLRRREYTGEGNVFRTKQNEDKVEVARPEDEWVKLPAGIIPPIISAELF